MGPVRAALGGGIGMRGLASPFKEYGLLSGDSGKPLEGFKGAVSTGGFYFGEHSGYSAEKWGGVV